MTGKDKLIMKYNPQIVDITYHTVSSEWYRMNVDYTWTGDGAVDIVQFTYDYDLGACPAYTPINNYNRMTAKEIAHALEI